jgi:hypothetical protein
MKRLPERCMLSSALTSWPARHSPAQAGGRPSTTFVDAAWKQIVTRDTIIATLKTHESDPQRLGVRGPSGKALRGTTRTAPKSASGSTPKSTTTG